MDDYKDNAKGIYDVGVIDTQIGEYLTPEEFAHEVALYIVPFAALEGGDFVCFDFRGDKGTAIV